MNPRCFFIPFWPLLNFWRIALNAGGISWLRIHRFLLISFYLFLTEPFRGLQILFHGKYYWNPKAVNPPVFIIGHWRSGTTFMQDALSKDKKFHYLSLYRMIAASHFRITEAWIAPVLNRLVRFVGWRYPLQRLPLDFNYSGELDVALTLLGSSKAYTWGHLFPRKFPVFYQRLILDESNHDWIKDYQIILSNLQQQAPNATLVLKSPGDTARISRLIRAFPEARFIYMHREKSATLASNEYLWNVLQRHYGFQRIGQEKVSALIDSTHASLLKAYEVQKAEIPLNQRIEIALEHLQEKPLVALQQVYDHFGFGPLPAEVVDFILTNIHQPQKSAANS